MTMTGVFWDEFWCTDLKIRYGECYEMKGRREGEIGKRCEVKWTFGKMR
jgi:hypothetical protein